MLDKTAEELRIETARIRRGIELLRDARQSDALATGTLNANAALNAAINAFSLNSGTDDFVVQGVRKRPTLLSGSGLSPSRSSSAAISVSSGAPTPGTSAQAVQATRSAPVGRMSPRVAAKLGIALDI